MSAGFILRALGFLVLICVGIPIWPGAARADGLSDGRFRDEVAALVRTLQPEAEIRLDSDPAQINVGPRTIALTNLYPRVARLSSAERRQAIAKFLADVLATSEPATDPGDFAAVKSRLRVQLVPEEILRQHAEIARRRFSETLFVVYVLDEPKRYRYVTRAMLAGWRVDPALVEATAIKNLAATSKDAPFSLGVGDGTPMFAIAESGDDYDAARLLVSNYLDEMRSALKADSITLAAPTRGALMAWPTDSAARRDLAAEVTRQMRAGPYARSDELFHFDRNGLRPLTAAERTDHGR
ncbi:DUF1444 family protein [Methylobacterium sp. J-077]|uniref:DUF1444 family protein n=1 Tax=Methylobacterium sp. J-077 TaxID=2836656 RepID=UPI001FB9E636|nr:DUF1444 family protein [Methylobacterium sp. J-077]MCJ2121558.1 DUF1444 family protein [Methylobacterium sp. J-077]